MHPFEVDTSGRHPFAVVCISWATNRYWQTKVFDIRKVLTYLLMPIAPGGAQAIYDPTPSHSVLGCSGHSGPVGPLLFQLCFSVSPPTVARPASLPLRVSGQGLACSAGCWLPEGVSDPAPLPPQYLLGHWFLSRSLPQIFISDLFLPLDFADEPETGVKNVTQMNLLRPDSINPIQPDLPQVTQHCDMCCHEQTSAELVFCDFFLQIKSKTMQFLLPITKNK